MLNFLKSLFFKEPQLFTGALLKDKDISEATFEEIVGMANPVIWKEKTDLELRRFPDLNQYKSYKCGAFSARKMLGILYWIKYGIYLDFSDEDIYQRRANRPYAGMWEDDIYNILSNGTTLKILAGNKNTQTDAESDAVKIEQYAHDVGTVFKTGKKIAINSIDIDTIASVIQTTGKPVLIMTYFSQSEYSQLVPKILDYNSKNSSNGMMVHYIIATDFYIRNGVKYLKCEDSAWFGGIADRRLTSEWVSKRVLSASYPMNFKFIESILMPTYTGSVSSLQDCLTVYGTFPSNVTNRGVYGSITIQAVKDFQTKEKLQVGGIINNETEARLKALFP